jgi:DNA primase
VILVCESCFSVFWLWQCGLPNAVATLGAQVSDQQIDMLVATRRPLIWVVVGDAGGRDAARHAIGKVVTRRLCGVIKLPDGMKPHRMPAEELQGCIDGLVS